MKEQIEGYIAALTQGFTYEVARMGLLAYIDEKCTPDALAKHNPLRKNGREDNAAAAQAAIEHFKHRLRRLPPHGDFMANIVGLIERTVQEAKDDGLDIVMVRDKAIWAMGNAQFDFAYGIKHMTETVGKWDILHRIDTYAQEYKSQAGMVLAKRYLGEQSWKIAQDGYRAKLKHCKVSGFTAVELLVNAQLHAMGAMETLLPHIHLVTKDNEGTFSIDLDPFGMKKPIVDAKLLFSALKENLNAVARAI